VLRFPYLFIYANRSDQIRHSPTLIFFNLLYLHIETKPNQTKQKIRATFEAEVDGKTFMVTVPDGGVGEGGK
jgi:hypothetical protein